MLSSEVSLSQFKIALLVGSASLDIKLCTVINWMTNLLNYKSMNQCISMSVNEEFSFTDKPFLGFSPVTTNVRDCLIV